MLFRNHPNHVWPSRCSGWVSVGLIGQPPEGNARQDKEVLGPVLTESRFSVFRFIKNQNWPLIGQRKITPPESKRRYFVETDFWAHRKEVAGDFLSKSKIKKLGVRVYGRHSFFISLAVNQKICSSLIHGLTAGWSYAQPRLWSAGHWVRGMYPAFCAPVRAFEFF